MASIIAPSIGQERLRVAYGDYCFVAAAASAHQQNELPPRVHKRLLDRRTRYASVS